MKIEVIKSKLRKRYHFRIRASNGKILCHSEQYNTPVDVLHAAKLIKEFAHTAEIVVTWELRS